MEMWNVILQAISSVGFPIVVCGYTLWYSREQNNRHSEDQMKMVKEFTDKIEELTIKHTEEVKGLETALNNNTQAMLKIVNIGREGR